MKTRKAKTISKQEIEQTYYLDPSSSMISVSEALGCSYKELKKAMRQYNMKPKPITRNWHKKSKIPQLSDREWLREQLKTKSARQIARELNTTSGNISDRITRYNLRSKSLTQSEIIKEGLKKKFPEGRFGNLSSHWKGGRVMRGNKSQYVMILSPNHPNKDKEGYVMEHRLVMEKKLGRYLLPTEIIHHINGKKNDNRLENLELHSRLSHSHRHFDAVKEVDQLKQELAKYKEKYGEI